MVGFNRRFAPLIQQMKFLMDKVVGPKAMIMTVNAGEIPLDHWTQDPEAGGGRLVGEACHFVDLLRFLAGAEIVSHHLGVMESNARDTFSIQLKFADGSHGAVHYLANGNKSFPKERLEVFCGGKILSLENFRVLQGYGWKKFKRQRLKAQDKGHTSEAEAFISCLAKGTSSPISLDELFEVTQVSLELEQKRLWMEK
jgi:predicted dehydrogenase